MKAKVRHIYELIIGAILSLLGFTACDKEENIEMRPAEYGMPHATFKVMGNVKAAENSKPIEGIVVKFSREAEKDRSWERAEFKSDKNGKVDGLFAVELCVFNNVFSFDFRFTNDFATFILVSLFLK